MTRDDLTTADLQNIAIALSVCDVKGIQQAAALLVLHQKVTLIISSDTEVQSDGSRNSTESDKPGADEPAEV